jgi:hypothetical protein
VTNKPPAGLTDADYDMIEAAVMETARGRWFLIEYDRRRRAAETAQLLDAVTRLERAVGTGGPPALAAPAETGGAARPGSRAPARCQRYRRAAAGHRLEHARARLRRCVCSAIEEQARLVRGWRSPMATAPGLRPGRDPTRGSKPWRESTAMPLSEKLALFV